MKIKKYDFEKSNLPMIAADKYGRQWPIVYILNNNKKIYIGEATDAKRRIKEHLNNPERNELKEVRIISDERFNMSATKDLEALLIRHIGADGKFELQNKNKGLQNHNYYQKDLYEGMLEIIWKELAKQGIVRNKILDIQNSNLFKFSPYTSLNDEQAEIANEIEENIDDIDKIMIKGGAGTGKSVLAIYLAKLLSDIQDQKTKGPKYKVGLVIAMDSLRATIKKVFSSIKGLKANMVISPSEVLKNNYDILIVDEAHRLRRYNSLGSYVGRFKSNCKKLKLDEREVNELDWIEMCSKKQILFYDTQQTIKPADIRKKDIEKYEKKAKTYKLTLQMRVSGGKEYINYIDDLINVDLKKKYDIESYDYKVFDNVDDMVNEIKKLDKKLGLCRNLAGFSWEWDQNDLQKKTIIIDGYSYLWNTTRKGWIESKNAINEIGCIHTAQGYDLNYTGVIFGEEISYDKDKKEIIILKENYKDKTGKKGASDEELKEYIKNIYNVILKRGIKGTYVYACNKELREYLKQVENLIKK